jgi:large-conductance mechanosensitive channel
MDETARNAPAESPAADAGRWIGRLLIAVILGEGIWGLIVSFTQNLILPLLAKTMGGDVQSPLYLGKGEVSVPALFTSVLELCFAGIVAVVLNAWMQRHTRSMRSRPRRVNVRPVQPDATTPAPAVTPLRAAASPIAPPVVKPAPPPAAPVTTTPPSAAPSSSPEQFWRPPESSPQPKAPAPPPPKPPAKPAKPKPPKEVYYNIVGEPINPTEDE